MLRRRHQPQTIVPSPQRAPGDFHEWLLSLPFVVERPYSLATPGVRSFGVDCAPLDRRQIWLITGMHPDVDVDGMGLAVILPIDVADQFEAAARGRMVAPMPAGHALIAVPGASLSGREELEALALTAYCCAMS